MKLNKKGQLGEGWANSLIYGTGALIVAGVFMSLGSKITGDVQDTLGTGACPALFPTYVAATDTCTNATGGAVNPTASIAWNITGRSLEGVGNLSSNQGTIGTIVAFSVIIGLLVGAFAYFMGKQ